MSIPNYLQALANHKGPAKITAGGMSIPVKIMDLEHRSNPYSGDMCTFNCMVVNPEEIQPERYPNAAAERLAKQALNSFYGARPDNYVQQALAKATNNHPYHRYAARDVATTEAACRKVNPFEIKKVYFNDPVTVVLWADGTKTIVRCQEGDVYSKETGLALCFAKKALGNKGGFNDVFHKWIPAEKETQEVVTVEMTGIGDPVADALHEMANRASRALRGMLNNA